MQEGLTPLLRDLDKIWGEVRGLEDLEQELEMMYQLHNGIPGNIVKIIMSTIEYFTAGLCDGPVWIRLRMQQIIHPTRSLYTASKMAEAETKIVDLQKGREDSDKQAKKRQLVTDEDGPDNAKKQQCMSRRRKLKSGRTTKGRRISISQATLRGKILTQPTSA